jgi:hypothetical protein
MSNTNNEKRNRKHSKLSFNRETLRILTGKKLDEVVGGAYGPPDSIIFDCSVSIPDGCIATQ